MASQKRNVSIFFKSGRVVEVPTTKIEIGDIGPDGLLTFVHVAKMDRGSKIRYLNSKNIDAIVEDAPGDFE